MSLKTELQFFSSINKRFPSTFVLKYVMFPEMVKETEWAVKNRQAWEAPPTLYITFGESSRFSHFRIYIWRKYGL